MSGGCYGYACFRLEEVADLIQHQDTNSRRAAFVAHLRKVAAALHDIEWVDSSDYEPGREHAAIDAVLSRPDAELVR